MTSLDTAIGNKTTFLPVDVVALRDLRIEDMEPLRLWRNAQLDILRHP